MNYLAHFYLAEPSEASLLGSILGDFVRGRLREQYPEDILEGIRLHRKIDAYSDSSSILKESRLLLGAEFRRYSGVIVDIAFDHFLALHWERFSSLKLEEFTSTVYELLERRHLELPAQLQQIAPRIIQYDWLGGYAHPDSLVVALRGVGRRIRRENPLDRAGAAVKAQYDRHEEVFLRFFPELIRFAQESRSRIVCDVPEWQRNL